VIEDLEQDADIFVGHRYAGEVVDDREIGFR
jgi:hypothetical protein